MEGEPQSLKEKHSSWTEEGKAEKEPQRPSVSPPGTQQPETLRRGQAELKAVKSTMNNAEEQISDLENRVMETTQSGQQTKSQMKKKKNVEFPSWHHGNESN